MQCPPSLITALLQPCRRARAALYPCCGAGCSCTWPAPWRCGPPAVWPHAVMRSDSGRWTAGSSASQVGPLDGRGRRHPAGGHAPRDSKQLWECMFWNRAVETAKNSLGCWQPACRLIQAALRARAVAALLCSIPCARLFAHPSRPELRRALGEWQAVAGHTERTLCEAAGPLRVVGTAPCRPPPGSCAVLRPAPEPHAAPLLEAHRLSLPTAAVHPHTPAVPADTGAGVRI